jgi:hypothetical protein
LVLGDIVKGMGLGLYAVKFIPLLSPLFWAKVPPATKIMQKNRILAFLYILLALISVNLRCYSKHGLHFF